MTPLQKKITGIIIEKLGLFESDVTDESDIMEDLGADSLDLIEILMQCEIEFSICIPDEEEEKIRTVNDIVEAVKSRLPTVKESL